MSEHTPLPWKTKYFSCPNIVSVENGECVTTIDGNFIEVLEGEDDRFSTDRNEANAEFIVKACNAYPKLVELLMDIIITMHPADKKYRKAKALLEELGESK